MAETIELVVLNAKGDEIVIMEVVLEETVFRQKTIRRVVMSNAEADALMTKLAFDVPGSETPEKAGVEYRGSVIDQNFEAFPSGCIEE